ncbi:MAG: response regulator [Bacteroidia bacterium]|nr:response regulator [Bacteroidia bacterium]
MRYLRNLHILLVENNPGDVRLIQEALKESNRDYHIHLDIVPDGEEALRCLLRQGTYADRETYPDLILLDLNLPKKDGREVLMEIKRNARLRVIPVIVLTTSEAEQDIQRTYELHANCYITKPVDINQFFEVFKAIELFWFNVVKLPKLK